MNFGQALEALKAGKRVRLRQWTDSWLVVERGSIVLGSNRPDEGVREYPVCGPCCLSDDWVIVNDKKSMMFGEALAALKEGKRVACKRWSHVGIVAHLTLEHGMFWFNSRGSDPDIFYKERWHPDLVSLEATDWQVVP